jgi:hypothetical protein
MDASREVIESAQPPRPPKPQKPIDTERRTRFLLGSVAVAAVASAAFTGITAWETHQDRVNNEMVYCAFYIGTASVSGDVNAGGPETDTYRRLSAQLGC